MAVLPLELRGAGDAGRGKQGRRDAGGEAECSSARDDRHGLILPLIS
jgi:hypothetical protein